VLFESRDKDWGNELHSHDKVPQHVDERTREGCPIHLGSQFITTCGILHRHRHAEVKLIVNLLLLGVVNPLILIFLLLKELFVESIVLELAPHGNLFLGLDEKVNAPDEPQEEEEGVVQSNIDHSGEGNYLLGLKSPGKTDEH
jgi:hypothetical protein